MFSVFSLGLLYEFAWLCIGVDNASAVKAMTILSVRLPVTFRCFVQTNENTIVRFSLSSSTIILVSGDVEITWKFAGDHPQRGRK